MDEDGSVGRARIRLGIVEDQPLYRQMLTTLLDSVSDLTVVASAGGVAEADASLDASGLDVALLDIQLGDGDGIELGRRLRAANPELGIVLLSAVDAMHTLLEIPRGELRAWSYLSKSSALSAPALVAAIRATAQGRTALDPALLQTRRPRRGSVVETLGDRQREVLALLAQGLSNTAIAERMGIAPRTVDNHLNAVYAALGLRADGLRNPRVEAAIRYLEETGVIER